MRKFAVNFKMIRYDLLSLLKITRLSERGPRCEAEASRSKLDFF